MVPLILGLIGFYLAHSYRRKIALSVAEKRLTAYSALWSRMNIASPVRLSELRNEPLTLEEREKLFNEFTQWYYENGNGMLLGGSTPVPSICVSRTIWSARSITLNPNRSERD